ncbi:MAG: LysR family transcriptional regulator [Eubacteriales bacterium]|nr:LysR family transcriptional regulator [Eubacteriales bacterium]MDD4390839.1 LysR family transcriptional regulator [Eubacteriales bacterium]
MFQGMEYVYNVYKEKSFSKAAKNLFTSQPSLSATVKRVEQRIGYPIFDRSTKPIKLTECGEKYIKSVEKIMLIENEFCDFINDIGELKSGKLVLGGSSLFSSWVLPSLIREFSRRFPLVKVELIEESTSELELLLQEGTIDLVLDNCLLDRTVFDCSLYQEEHLLLAVPSGFEINKENKSYILSAESIRDGSFLNDETKAVPIEIFHKQPFIMLKPENETGKRAMNILRKHDIIPSVVFELDQQMTSYNITCSGMGISFISDTLISRVPAHPNVVYYKLAGADTHRSIYFYWKAGRYFKRTVEEFLKMANNDRSHNL